ncbi:MAG: type II secretion system F family protein [Gemmatimonadaceae bacterium]|nr:type II secretion system F family protein [Gemmatimonadaceae bacterium]
MPSLAGGWDALKIGQHRAALYRAWGAAYNAGFPHTRAMAMLGAQPATTEPLRRAIEQGGSRGASLAASLRAAPTVAEPFEAALLITGEESGTIDASLRLLAEHWTAHQRLMQWVVKQMTYPLMTAFAACFIAPFPLAYFGHVGAYAVVSVGSAVALVTSGGAIVGLIARSFARRPSLVVARLIRTLATAVEAGLPLDRVTSLAAAASGDPAIVAHVERQSPRARATQSLTDTLRGIPQLTPDVYAMLSVADRTGDYSTTLSKLASLLEDGFR